jgi:hypothetical protein
MPGREDAMCDIVDLKCEHCGVEINVHIGDFSAGRKQVHPFCPECQEPALAFLQRNYGRQYMVFTDWPAASLEDAKEACENASAHCPFLFIVDMPRNIHLNA